MINNLVNKHKTQGFFPTLHTALFLSMLISLLFNITIIIIIFFGEGVLFPHHALSAPRPQFQIERFIFSLIYIFFISFVLYWYNYKIQKTDFKNKALKVTIIVLGSIVITIVFNLLIFLIHYSTGDLPPFIYRLIRNNLLRDFFVMAIVIFSWQLLVLRGKQQTTQMENELLVAENMRTRFEVLKNQMNPHFLFNALNTLQSLIGTDDDKAREYVQLLSQVLRHSLQNKEVVTLNEEIQFTQAYCNLMQVRYGHNLNFKFSINEAYNNYLILPLSLQVLIENSIKHNVISNKQPLVVEVFTDDNANIIISNPIHPKHDEEEGNGIGLYNLSERYRLKWSSDIKVDTQNEVFEVTLKLVKP